MTHIHEDQSDENNDRNYPTYSSGLKYFYYDYFKENQTGQAITAGTRVMEFINLMNRGS